MKRWARGPLLPVLSVGLLVAALCALLVRGRKRPAPVPDCVPSDDVWTVVDWDEGGGFAAPPLKPRPGQRKPPCNPPLEMEAMGSCWIDVHLPPPCPEGSFAYGKTCLVPSMRAQRPPVSAPAK